MQKNIKTIVIPEIIELCPLKRKPIFKTTIVNSPNIISSKNNYIIKQYINTRDTDGKILEKTIKLEKKFDKYQKNNIYNYKNQLVYHKQGFNHLLYKNDSYKLNNTTTIINKNKNSFNNNNITSKNDISNFDNKTERNDNNNQKKCIESYNYIHPKQKAHKFDNSNDENEFRYFEEYPNNINNERNKHKKFDEVKNDLAKTYERIISNKNINNGSNNYNNNDNNNKNENYDSMTLKANATETNIHIKNLPFKKHIIKSNYKTKEYSTINSYTKLYKQNYSSSRDNKNKEKVNKKTLSSLNENLFKGKNISEGTNDLKKIKEKGDNNYDFPLSTARRNKDEEDLSFPLFNNAPNKNMTENNENHIQNRAYSIPSFKTIIKNNSLSKASLRFLIKKASKDKDLRESFRESYEKNKTTSVEKNIEKLKNASKNNNEKNINKNEQKVFSNEKDSKKNIGLNTIYVRNKKRNINLYFNNNTNFYNVKDNKKKLIINNIETIKKDNNSTKEYRNIIYEKKHKENINTNKKYNNYNINQLFRTLRNFNVKKNLVTIQIQLKTKVMTIFFQMVILMNLMK